MSSPAVAVFVNALAGRTDLQSTNCATATIELALAMSKRLPGFIYATEKDPQVVDKLKEHLSMTGNTKIIIHPFDVKDPASVKAFINHLRSKVKAVDILVINCSEFVEHDKVVTLSEQAQHVLNSTYQEVRQICAELFPLLKPNGRVLYVVDGTAYIDHIPGQTEKRRFRDLELTEEKLQQLLDDYVSDLKSGKDVSKTWGTESNVVAQNAIVSLAFLHQRNFDKTNDNICVNVVHFGYFVDDITHGYGQPVLKMEQIIKSSLKLCLQPSTNVPCKGLFFWYNRNVIDRYDRSVL